MEITEVRVKLVEGKQDKLKAFCSITIEDSFVIRDLKIIEGSKGLFVAMPSRRLTSRCQKCGSKNPIRCNFCNECGYAMPQDRAARTRNGRLKLHADIAHPINSNCREEIQDRVIRSFEDEIEAASKPGYRPTTFDDFDEPEEPVEELVYEGAPGPEAAEASSGDDAPSSEGGGFGPPPIAAARREGGGRGGRGRTNRGGAEGETEAAVSESGGSDGERGERGRGESGGRRERRGRGERGGREERSRDDQDGNREEREGRGGRGRGRRGRGRRGGRRDGGGRGGEAGNRSEGGNRGERGERSESGRGEGGGRREGGRGRRDRQRSSRERDFLNDKPERPARRPQIHEQDDTPPDDNFGAGLF